MDPKGLPFPAAVTLVAAALLWWHMARARKGVATPRDRWMGALWAAMIVVAGARVVWILVVGPSPAEPTPAPDAGIVK